MTASLVVLDPTAISPAQETLWYWGYAIALWIVVAIIALFFGKNLLMLVLQPIEQNDLHFRAVGDE